MAPSPAAVRVVHLTDFSSEYPGSFVDSMIAVRGAAEARGWLFEAAFAEGAEDRPWYDELRRAGMSVRIAAHMPRRARTEWMRGLLAERPGPTILHTHFAYWDLPAVLAARREPGPVSVVWHRHGSLGDELLPRARQAMRFAVAGRRVDAHLCVSPTVYAAVLKRFSPPERTYLFPNAIDLRRFAPPSAEERARARATFDLADEVDVLVSFVWDWERKGGALLLQALHELRAGARSVVLLMVGRGEQAEETLRGLDLEQSVRLIAPRGDARSLYAAADVFVTASAREGMPYALLEALACGTPVVASNIREHRDLAKNLPACRLAARTPSAFSTAIEQELDAEPAVRSERLSASRAYLEANFGIDAWAERLCDIYEQLISGRSNGSRASGEGSPRSPTSA